MYILPQGPALSLLWNDGIWDEAESVGICVRMLGRVSRVRQSRLKRALGLYVGDCSTARYQYMCRKNEGPSPGETRAAAYQALEPSVLPVDAASREPHVRLLGGKQSQSHGRSEEQQHVPYAAASSHNTTVLRTGRGKGPQFQKNSQNAAMTSPAGCPGRAPPLRTCACQGRSPPRWAPCISPPFPAAEQAPSSAREPRPGLHATGATPTT